MDDKILEQLYLSKIKVDDIALKEGVSRGTIYNRLKKLGVLVNPFKNKEELEDLYKQFSPLEIASKKRISGVTVNKYLNKYNIKRIPHWQRYYDTKINKKQEEILLGTLLGDACLSFFKKDKINPFLGVGHSVKQLDYLKWKQEIFSSFLPSKKLYYEKSKNFYSFHSTAHPEFIYYYELFYSSGRKEVNKEIISKLTPLSVLFWYLDDGCLFYNKSKKVAGVNLSTQSFDYKENLLLIEYLYSILGMEAKIYKCKTGFGYYIHLCNKAALKFLGLLKELKIPEEVKKCFSYKLKEK